jgi:hypothetical protein
MTALSETILDPLYAINRVAIDVPNNQMAFYKDTDMDVSFYRGSWSLYGGMDYQDLDSEDRKFWQPFSQIPTAISYVNYRLYSTRIMPENETAKQRLKEIMDEQIANGTDIADEMRSSVDEQIALIPDCDLQIMIKKQNRQDDVNEIFMNSFDTKNEWRQLRGGPSWEGLDF